MATKMLGKVVAGAALGGASLLAFTPGIALADGAQGDKGHHKGKVYADPHSVQPGHDVKLIEVCVEPQEEAFVWSEVTGKVKLHSREDNQKPGGHERGEQEGGWPGGGAREEEGGWPGEQAEGGQPGSGSPETQPGAREGGAPEQGAQPGGGATPPEGGWGGGDQAKDDAKKDEDKKKADEEAKKKAEEEAKKKGEKEAAAEAAAAGDEKYFVYYGEAKVAWDAEPGTYELKGSCGVGSLVVLPKGHVKGGDGGAAGGDRGLALGGATMLGAAALGGIVLMRRRRTNESLV